MKKLLKPKFFALPASMLLAGSVFATQATSPQTGQKVQLHDVQPVVPTNNTQQNHVQQASNSVYRIWVGVPMDSTFFARLQRELENNGDLRAQNVQELRNELDNKGYIVLNDILIFKSKGKPYVLIGHGSGYLVDNNGTIVSNAHVFTPSDKEKLEIKEEFGSVMDGAGEPAVFVVHQMEPRVRVSPIEILDDTDASRDLAVGRAHGLSGVPIKFASPDHTQVPQKVYAIGFPSRSDYFSSGEEGVFNVGPYLTSVIKDGSLSRNYESNGVQRWEHSATLSGGNSGGPLVNECGEVVGTNANGLIGVNGDSGGTSGAIHNNELIPLLTQNKVEFVQVSEACNPAAATANNNPEPQKASTDPTAEATDQQDLNTQDTKSPSDKVSGGEDKLIAGMPQGVFFGIIAGIGALLLGVILFLLLRKKKTDSTSSVSNQQAHVPTRTQNIPVSPKTDFSELSRTPPSTEYSGPGTIKTTVSSVSSVHLDPMYGNYPLTLRENIPFVVGRNPDCDLMVANNKVSSRHVQFIYRSGAVYVSDLQSTNGTYVNGSRISGETRIQNGDVVSLTRESIAGWKFGHGGSSAGSRAVGHLVFQGVAVPTVHLQPGQRLTVGRSSSNDIVINHPTVSGNHCVISVDNQGNLEVIDQGSTNGVFVGQVSNRVSRAYVQAGQTIFFGSQGVRAQFNKTGR